MTIKKLDPQTIELIATTAPEDIARLFSDLLSPRAKRELQILARPYISDTVVVWPAVTSTTKKEIIEVAQEL